MFEETESGSRLRKKRKLNKSDAPNWTRRFYLPITNYQSPNLRDFQFLQLGFRHYAVFPATRGVILFEHFIQLADMAD